MRFQIPQFIETETKLVGPFTLKQFLWIAAGTAVLYLSFMIFGLSIWFFLIAVPVAALSVALAFLKINEVPLVEYIAYGLNYLINPKKYLFRKEDGKINLP